MKGKIAALAVVLAAAAFVGPWESTSLVVYRDPIGVPTVCTGETDRELTIRERFTAAECSVVLGASLQRHAIELDRCVKRPVEAHEATALLAWAFNVGVPAACRSTLVRKLNAGEPYCAEYDRWVYADGKKLRGLVRRAAAQRKLCEGTT